MASLEGALIALVWIAIPTIIVWVLMLSLNSSLRSSSARYSGPQILHELSVINFDKAETPSVAETDPREPEPMTQANAADLRPASIAPKIPSELIEAIASGRAVLFAGNGLGPRAGWPTWDSVLRGMSRISESTGGPPASSRSMYDAAFEVGDLNTVRQLLTVDIGESDRNAFLSETFGGNETPIPKLYRSLAAMPFAHVITPMLDTTLERAFRLRRPTIDIVTDGERLDETSRYSHLAFFKLRGDANEPITIRFTTDEYRSALLLNPTFSKTVASLALSNTILYLGASVQEIQEFLSEFTLNQHLDRPHFALASVDTPGADLAAHLLKSRYGVTLLHYESSTADTEVEQIVTQLAAQVAYQCELSPTPTVAERLNPDEARITRVALNNIGPFSQVAFELNQHWNVLLGINGAGKSTVLKAIALCLCGDDPTASSGQFLLNTEADRGSIVLTIDGVSYRSDLTRERGRVRVSANRLTPLQRGSALALGFPALRGPSEFDPKGPSDTESQWPESEDLAPLLNPAADRRLGSFKQWIVNLDSRLSSETDPQIKAKYEHALDMSFIAIRQLSGNASIKFARVDKQSWRVLLSTLDVAELPLDMISQGMTSLLAWIGVALERFAEINPSLDRPEEAPGIILIDEIDAHLHPSWQRELVSVLRNIFPNAQIIATTHSPLIVGGMKSDEVFVTRRDIKNPKLVTIEPLDLKFKGLRADQVLASAAFDMPSSREPESADILSSYEALVYKTRRSPEENEYLRTLSDKLDSFLYSGVTAEQIEAERVDSLIVDDPASIVNRHLAGSLTPDERASIQEALLAQKSIDA